MKLLNRELDADALSTAGGMLSWMIIGLIFWIALLWLCGCSVVNYEAKPDGTTNASGFTIGTNNALSGARFKTDGKGARSLELDALNADQVEGLKQINQGLSLIIEGAVKGAK